MDPQAAELITPTVSIRGSAPTMTARPPPQDNPIAAIRLVATLPFSGELSRAVSDSAQSSAARKGDVYRSYPVGAESPVGNGSRAPSTEAVASTRNPCEATVVKKAAYGLLSLAQPPLAHTITGNVSSLGNLSRLAG